MNDKCFSIVDRMRSGSFDFDDAKIRTAYALNLCTVSVSQIIDYNDIVVLEQEYEAILNNLNIERMPKDEALLSILKQLLDTITFFRIQEGDKRFIDREYQNKMKNAIWSAVPNFGLIVAGGNPISMAVSLASQVGIGYMNYRKVKAENAFAQEKQMWQLQRSAIEQFNGLRRELFDTAWRLVDAHELPDEYRLTERQVKQYNEILMDPDYVRRYERLDTIKESFVAYPPFWYFFGNTANTLSRSTAGEAQEYYLNAAKTYFEIFVRSFSACNLQRENQVASACALEYVDLLRLDVPEEREKIPELIDFALRMSGNANDVLQLCAFSYLKIGDFKSAAAIFRRLVNEGYNAVVNSQLLSGYYVSEYLAGDTTAERGYTYLKSRINEEYLFPFPNTLMLPSGTEITTEQISNRFIDNQKEILAKKFEIAINLFKGKYRVRFNRCVPVPEGKKYTDSYFDGSAVSYAARKADGIALKNKKVLERYIEELNNTDYPYSYLPVLNDMLNSVFLLNCVQGKDVNLVDYLGKAIIKNREKLTGFAEDRAKFTYDTYEEMLEISFDELTEEFFNYLEIYSGVYVKQKNDIIAMNEAEMNLREFCINQGFDAPDVLYQTANDIVEESAISKQYLSIELLEDGELPSVANNRYDEVQGIMEAHCKGLCTKNGAVLLYMSSQEEFERYFIKASMPNMREIRRKTVAVLDDTAQTNSDLLFTTEGIVQIVKGRVKELVPYDEIALAADNSAIILHQPYANRYVNMDKLIELVSALRGNDVFEVREKKTPLGRIADFATLMKKQLPDMDGKK